MGTARDATVATEPPPSCSDLGGAVARQLPLACFMFDTDGVVRWADERVTLMHGVPPGSLVGHHVMELVHPDDLGRTAEMLAYAPTSVERTMGPIPLRHVDAAGTEHPIELWVTSCLDEPEIQGFVCQVGPETVDHRLTSAVTRVAAADAGHAALAEVARSMSAHPILGLGAVVVADTREVFADDRLPAPLTGRLPAVGPWRDALTTASPLVAELAAIPEPFRTAAATADLAAVWCWPVVDAGEHAHGVLMVWRPRPEPPSPNQTVHLERAASVAWLVIEGEQRRRGLEASAYLDPLTGLANRAYLFGPGADIETGSAVLYIDLDGFKAVNDAHGHHVGDRLLEAAGERLRRAVRTKDTVARIGGDEFVLVCTPPCPVHVTTQIAERILASVSRPFRIDDQTLRIGASIGIAVHDGSTDLSGLVRLADAALYRAKSSGRGQWQLASPAVC